MMLVEYFPKDLPRVGLKKEHLSERMDRSVPEKPARARRSSHPCLSSLSRVPLGTGIYIHKALIPSLPALCILSSLDPVPFRRPERTGSRAVHQRASSPSRPPAQAVSGRVPHDRARARTPGWSSTLTITSIHCIGFSPTVGSRRPESLLDHERQRPLPAALRLASHELNRVELVNSLERDDRLLASSAFCWTVLLEAAERERGTQSRVLFDSRPRQHHGTRADERDTEANEPQTNARAPYLLS
jgi:hypothetical protein